jgi:transcriptional regulator with GAF, ATPase, and Fis domain
MNPRLICLAGPRQGSVFPLDPASEFSIGRDAGNQVSVLDLTASRRHCALQEKDGRFQLNDLESRNGTFVNGLPVTERWLEHGDRIRVGVSTFLFLLREEATECPSSDVEMKDGEWNEASSMALPDTPETMDGGVASDAASERTVADLRAVLRINSALGTVRGLDALEQRLLESLAEVTPADRGAVILTGKNPGEFASIFGWDKYPHQERPVQVSRPAIDRALRERTAFLGNDLTDNIASLLVVPLVVLDRTVGVIYLDTANPQTPFTENHLQLLAAVGPVAGVALENARRVQWLQEENDRLQNEVAAGRDLIGECAAMKDVHQFIAKVAPSDSTVLICGESGTGKELVARAVHAHSGRADGPFVAINCAALTESLLEAEMFGHEKGAFTGAAAQRKGKLESANGGTFFLDEVGELSPVLQAKLLRVLQEREFERVGGTRTIQVDLRLIAATNRDLKEAIQDKSFRQDLYYRLNVVSVTLPPLRARRQDISLLATYFISKHGGKSPRPLQGLSPEARACLMNYDWPGNVRELENAMERAVVVRSGDVILPEDLPDSVLEAGAAAAAPGGLPKYHAAVLETKKQLILKALELTDGNYTEAAKALGVQVNYLHRLIRNMNLKAKISTSKKA